KPRVGFTGCQAFHLKPHRDFPAVHFHAGIQRGVVPGVTGSQPARTVGTFRINCLQLRKYPFWLPAQAEWDVNDVQTQVSHDTNFAAGFRLSLPIHQLVWIEITAMKKTSSDFKQSPQFTVAGIPEGSLTAGQKWKFRTAADKTLITLCRRLNGARGLQVNAEWFFSKQIFSGFENVETNLFMQIMRYRDIDSFNLLGGQQFVMVSAEQFHRWYLAKPFAPAFHRIAYCQQLGLHGMIVEHEPAAQRAGHFAPHQPAANDADSCPDTHKNSDLRNFAAEAASASSWTMAIKAFVIPAGLECWMTLRP